MAPLPTSPENWRTQTSSHSVHYDPSEAEIPINNCRPSRKGRLQSTLLLHWTPPYTQAGFLMWMRSFNKMIPLPTPVCSFCRFHHSGSFPWTLKSGWGAWPPSSGSQSFLQWPYCKLRKPHFNCLFTYVSPLSRFLEGGMCLVPCNTNARPTVRSQKQLHDKPIILTGIELRIKWSDAPNSFWLDSGVIYILLIKFLGRNIEFTSYVCTHW